MKHIKEFKEGWFWNREKKEPQKDSNSRWEEYKGHNINVYKYTDSKYFGEDAGKRKWYIWTIPADIHPAYEGEGGMDDAKHFLDMELYDVSRRMCE